MQIESLNNEPTAPLPLKVMVVDDTAVNRQILKVFLERLGFGFVAAGDGDEAIEVFMRDRPDVVLMDVMMPQVNGYEATRRIRELSGERWVPVIFISALDRNDNLIDGLEAGGDDFMSKPINFIVLDAKLRSLRRMVELQRRLEETRRRSAAITENIVDGVVTFNLEGLIQSVNPAACRIFMRPADVMLGMHISTLIAPSDHGSSGLSLSADLISVFAHSTGVRNEISGLRQHGEVFPMEFGVSEIRLIDQHLFVAILRDITERKQIERRLRDNAERLEAYRDHQEREHALTREIIERQMARPGLSDPHVHHWVAPAQDFSGDIVAAARASNGRLFAMLADGCGHGLAPAISVMPVLTMFYSLIEAEVSPDLAHVVDELNRQLVATLPGGRFVAGAMLCIDEAQQSADIWVGGIPMLFWLGADGKLKQSFASSHLSLGIIDSDADLLSMERVNWQVGDRFVACSDGLLESPVAGGEAFGIERFVTILESCPPGADLLTHVRTELVPYIGANAPSDDISLLVVECGP